MSAATTVYRQRQAHSSRPCLESRYGGGSPFKYDSVGREWRVYVKRSPGEDESRLSLTKNPRVQGRTKHIDVQHIISASQSMETNCMLPEYWVQKLWTRDPQTPSSLKPLKGTGPTVTRLTRVRRFSRQCREGLARDEVTNAFRIGCLVYTADSTLPMLDWK